MPDAFELPLRLRSIIGMVTDSRVSPQVDPIPPPPTIPLPAPNALSLYVSLVL